MKSRDDSRKDVHANCGEDLQENKHINFGNDLEKNEYSKCCNGLQKNVYMNCLEVLENKARIRFGEGSHKTASVVWWLAYWPLDPEFAGSNPAEAVGFLGRPENPHYAFLRREVK